MKSIFNFITGPLMTALKPLLHFWAMMFNPAIAVLLGAYSLLQWIYRTMTGQDFEMGKLTESYEVLKTTVGTAAFGAFPSAVLSVMTFVNYVFPITEALILISLLCGLYILAIAFRVVKSWIPTVN